MIGAVLLALPISARDRQATDLLSSFLHRLPLPASPDWWYSTPDSIGPPWAGGHFRPDSAGRSGTGNLHQWIYIVSATQAGSKGYADRQRVYKRQYLGSSPFAPHHYVFTFVCEAFGSFLLMLRFVPMFGARESGFPFFCRFPLTATRALIF